MHSRSYVIAAVVLGALVGVSFFLTLGFSMTAWAWMFSIAACVLGVAGALNTAGGLGASRRIGVALASPGLVWAAGNLHEWIQPTPVSSVRYDLVAAYLAALAAGAAALKLIEMMSRLPRAVVGIGYALLAVTALLVGVVQIAIAMRWTFIGNPLYTMTSRSVFAASSIVEYGAFIGAAVLITIRYDLERWSCVAISLVSSFLLYKRVHVLILLRPLENVYGFLSWLQPIAIFIAAAAVWRMGSILREQSLPAPFARLSPS